MRGVIPQHLKARFDMLEALPSFAEPPEPWRSVGQVAVGGLASIGFSDSSDLLLVASSGGRGVFDCRTGQLLARDDGTDFDFDTGNLLLKGIGPLAEKEVRMSGIDGGGLATRTADGWGIEPLPLSWPDEEIILSPPGQTMLWTPAGQSVKLSKLSDFAAELRAFGFSPTGHSLVVATAANLSLFSRP